MFIKYLFLSCIFFTSSVIYAQSSIPQTGRAPGTDHSFGTRTNNALSSADTFCVAAYCFDVNTSSIFILGGCPGGFLSYWTPPTIPQGGVRGGNGKYYILDTGPPTTLWLLDTLTGTVTLLGEITGMEPGATGKGLAYDPINNSYYMCGGVSFVTNNLYELDVNTLEAALVSAFPQPNGMMIAIAINSSGTGFGYDIVDDMAYTFDPETGGSSLLGNIGFDANYAQDMDYDLSTGTIYLSAFNNTTFTGQLRIMDPNTGNTTLVFDFPDQVSVIEFNNQYSIIPVELTSFNAEVLSSKVKLKWTTATETNNKGFEIQRSEDNSKRLSWETVIFIEGKGTTTETHHYQYTDKELPDGKYVYRLKQIDFNGEINYSKEVYAEIESDYTYRLDQNYPNPFNPVTSLSYSIPVKSFVNLEIYNTLGQKIKTLVNSEKEAGSYKVKFNADNLPSGMYLYKLTSGKYSETRKMLLLK